ncbi:hypothetical protein P7F88_21625 [Vibrio hannami]|nr:hypothetical protein [Vibrio hannami]MDG3088522.1 hypothetical protein [Vibrio hannami]
MATRKEVKSALYNWSRKDVKEFSEAPLAFRIVGLAIVSLLAAISVI